MIEQLIIINYKGGEKFFDVFEEGKIMSYSRDLIKLDIPIPSISHQTDSLDEALNFVSSNWKPNSLVLSNDHVITYAGLKGIQPIIKNKKFGLVVVDYHIDFYSDEYTGDKKLNKGNVFRKSLDQGLLDYIVFVGIRPSEEAMYRDTKVEISEQDKIYSLQQRKEGIFYGLEGKFSIIPSYECESFSSGVINGLKILKDKEISNIGLDFDLDGFDSEAIVGVEYNKYFADKISDFIVQRICEKKKLNLEKLKEVVDYTIFMKSEISQKGLPAENIKQELKNVFNFIKDNKMELIYRGITEYEPSNDDGNTKLFVEDMLSVF